MTDTPTETKRPFYQRWGMWAAIAGIAVAGLGVSALSNTTTAALTAATDAVPQVCIDALKAGDELIGLTILAMDEATLIIGESGEAFEAAALRDVERLRKYTDLVEKSTAEMNNIYTKTEGNQFYTLKDECLAVND